MGKKKNKNNKYHKITNKAKITEKHVKENNKEKTKKTKSKKAKGKSLVSKKDVKMKFKFKHPKVALTLKIIFITILLILVVGTGIVAGLVFGVLKNDINIDLKELVLVENSIIVDSTGNVIAELSGDENRKIITLDEMSPYLPKAYIAIEDERFRTHHGVDIKRTGAAILSFITHGGKSTTGGGSTITQQLVKNITQEKDTKGIDGITRKLKEWYRAYKIEDELSKDQILEIYLNLIFVGGKQDNRGVEIASEYYFNKSAKDLSIAQCAFIAGINHSPNSYNPYNGKEGVPERTIKRTTRVLNQMKKNEFITQEEYDIAIKEVNDGFKFENGAKGNVYSSHTDALLTQLIDQIVEEKQISKNAAKSYLYGSGLKIYSTQVTNIQNIMEEEAKKDKYVLKSRENKNEDGSNIYAQAAMAVIEPKTGYVVGCIGQLGEKNTSRGLNRAISVRQTGSSIKPLATLVPGIEEGIINPATKYMDSYTIFGKDYDPGNYNGFTGPRNVRNSVTTSQNIPFLKIMAELSPKKSMEYLKKMGITTIDEEKDNNLALAIGGLTRGVSTLEMASAYASIANDGTYIEPTFYSKVEDSQGKVIIEPKQKTEKVCSPETAYMVKDLMESVVKGAPGYGGTASYCKINGIDVAAKTGTTNESKDRWLCGFTNYYSAAVWFGYDKPERVNYKGRNPAGQIFDGVMTEIHKGLPNSEFIRPDNIVNATVCSESGLLATDKCAHKYSEIFVKGHLPKSCDGHGKEVTICKDSGKIANEYCPEDRKEVKSSGYLPEKEKLGLWNTPSNKDVIQELPNDVCDIHKKPEPKPEPEPEEKPNKDEDGEKVEDEKKPEEDKKPEEKPENNKEPEKKPEVKPEEKPKEDKKEEDKKED